MDSSTRRSFHIGRYHCVESLAQGPLGETFRAKVYGVAGLEKQYALKQIDAALRVDPDVRRRLVEGARLYATLDHERIARLTEIHDADEALYLVLELARGIDCVRLAAHLRARGEALPVEQAILIGVDVAEALQVAHRPSATAPGGVLHTGLSPSTIMVLGEGEARVGDFALAGALQRPSWETEDDLVPLLAYVAPECLAGQPPTHSADLWSLGAVIYELCTGNVLYSAQTAAELANLRDAKVSWDRLPIRPGLRELLELLLAFDPARRMTSAADVRERLMALLGLELTRARVGLQALARRALGRGLMRTGTFAAVAIPSAELPTLVPEPPRPAPADLARRPGWAPPRSTAILGAIRPSEMQEIRKIPTLPGIGDELRAAEPPQMELAELPPSDEASVTERSFQSIAFDEGVTTPRGRSQREEQIDALETDLLELEVSAAYDGPTNPDATMGATPGDAVTTPIEGVTTPIEGVTTPIAVTTPAAVTASSGTAIAIPIAQIKPIATPPVLRVPAPPTAPIAPRLTTPMFAAPPPAPVLVVPPPVPSRSETITAPMPEVQAPAPAPPLLRTSETITTTMPEVPDPAPLMIEHVAPPAAFVPIVPRVYTKPAPARLPAHRSSGIWIAAGLLGLVIAVAILVAGEHGGWSTRPAPVVIEPAKPTEPIEIATKPTKVEPPTKVELPTKVESPTNPAKTNAPEPVAGQLVIRSTPEGASVWIDGEMRGTTPLTAPATPGQHNVALALEGSQLVQQHVGAGGTLDKTLEPAKLPSELLGSGGLKVRCRTQGEFRILVDGHDTGHVCPNSDRIVVAPGVHKIGLLSLRNGETKEIDGEVADDADHSTRIYVKY